MLIDVCCHGVLDSCRVLHEWMALIRLPACPFSNVCWQLWPALLLCSSAVTLNIGAVWVVSGSQPILTLKIEATGPRTAAVCCRWGKPC